MCQERKRLCIFFTCFLTCAMALAATVDLDTANTKNTSHPVKSADSVPTQAMVPAPTVQPEAESKQAQRKAKLESLQKELAQKQAELQKQQKIESLQKQLAQKQAELKTRQQLEQKAKLAVEKAKVAKVPPPPSF